MSQVERIEGGGSYSICPDTGAVTRTTEPADAPQAAGPAPDPQPPAAAEPEPTLAPATGKRAKSTNNQES